MAKYTYFLDFDDGAGDVEFIPDADAEYTWEKAHEETGAYMRKMANELTITTDLDNEGVRTNAAVYATLWEWYFDITKHQTLITLTIKKDGVADYTAEFYVNIGNIDVNTGSYSFKAESNDSYDILLSKGDDEVDIIDGVGTYTANYTYHASLQEEDSGSTTVPPSYPPTGSWVRTGGSGSTIWRRQVSLYDLGSPAGITPIKYGDLWYYPTDDLTPITKVFAFPNCFTLMDSIQFILTTILNGTTISTMSLSQLQTAPLPMPVIARRSPSPSQPPMITKHR